MSASKDALHCAAAGRAFGPRGQGGAGGDFLVRGPWKCPVCGAGQWWCRLSRDGSEAWCTKVSDGAAAETENVNGRVYIHRLDGSRRERAAAVAREAPVGDVEAASPDDLHAMNCQVLGALSLPPERRAELREQRRLTDEQIDAEGFKYLPREGRARLARGLVERFGDGLARRLPGVYWKTDPSDPARGWWSLAGAEGFVVPCRGLVDGAARVLALKVRAADDVPRDARFTYVSSYKRGGCKAVVAPHHPAAALALRAAGRRDLVLVESEIAATVVTALSGRPAVAVAGVSNALRFGPAVARDWPADVVRVAFDNDPKHETRAKVARIARDLLVALRDGGFDGRLLTFPAAHKGYDDFCASRQNSRFTHGPAPR